MRYLILSILVTANAYAADPSGTWGGPIPQSFNGCEALNSEISPVSTFVMTIKRLAGSLYGGTDFFGRGYQGRLRRGRRLNLKRTASFIDPDEGACTQTTKYKLKRIRAKTARVKLRYDINCVNAPPCKLIYKGTVSRN